VNINVNASLVG